MIPSATYRLQFHKGFTFRQARDLAPYLERLGVSHIYASPYFRAAPGSLHGYDICDHNALNPEVGSREDFDAYIGELKRLGLGQMLDFVPNHMGISESTNAWWMDVLENGPSSPYARYFDVNWRPVKRELENTVLLPILGDQYGRVLENGELKLAFEEGTFRLVYYERILPIASRTTRPILQRARERIAQRGETPPAELESIMTALDYLPERTETDPEKIKIRSREKEIIKMRLARLADETPVVRSAIDEVVAEMQTGGDTRNFDALDALISAQPYRLAYWRVASEEINYRRFFDINNLAAIRMELPEVFESAHRLVFELIASGAIDALRIDHVDGLWHPRAYLDALQKRAASLLASAADQERPLYLLVEKILGESERLRPEWPAHGTTGYEFANQVTAVLVDQTAEQEFTDGYSKFINRKLSYAEVVYRSKRLTMQVSMASEVNVLGHMLNRLSETNRWYRDFTLNALITVIREVIACFPVYRTYITPEGQSSEQDVRIIDRAIRAARRRNPAIERSVFEFLRHVLLPPENNPHPVDEEARVQFVMKFQQCTGPITAKGVEDTAFYVFNRLVALNEVGGEPGTFGASVEHFHQQNVARRAEVPHSLLAGSTHDTKRSEDVRARITALSEMPGEWMRALRRWHTANRKYRREIDGDFAPDSNEEYLLYQTLLGSWPLSPMSADERSEYIRRIREYMRKALHEAKVNSSWIEANEAWDTAVEDFAEKILTPRRGNSFLKSFEPLADRIAEFGMVNALAQTVLKLTVPGVPDLYQGNELWDLSLVDPDNRRPVDYGLRARLLTSLEGGTSCSELLENWRDGRVKLFVTQRLLLMRRDQATRDLFAFGDYTPVAVHGELADCVISFSRRYRGRTLLVIVPRLSSRVGFLPIGEKWRDTHLAGNAVGQLREVFSGRTLTDGSPIRLEEALRDFPIAVFTEPAS